MTEETETPMATEPTTETPTSNEGLENATPAAAEAPAVNNDWRFDAKSFEDVDVSETFINEYEVLAKKYGINQDIATSLLKDAVGLNNRLDVETVAKQNEEWVMQAKNDKEFGGIGFEANIGIAQKALNAYASQGFKQLMEDTGLGNHPEVIRLFYNIGKTIKEDSFVNASAGISKAKTLDDAAKILFG